MVGPILAGEELDLYFGIVGSNVFQTTFHRRQYDGLFGKTLFPDKLDEPRNFREIVVAGVVGVYA